MKCWLICKYSGKRRIRQIPANFSPPRFASQATLAKAAEVCQYFSNLSITTEGRLEHKHARATSERLSLLHVFTNTSASSEILFLRAGVREHAPLPPPHLKTRLSWECHVWVVAWICACVCARHQRGSLCAQPTAISEALLFPPKRHVGSLYQTVPECR